MLFDYDIKGNLLARKTVCLTYDDGPGETSGGPGPDTRELGRFLHEEGIGATFFVIGRHAEGRADLLRQLRGWGHLVGNHTWSHPSLVALALAGGDVADEVERTDAVLGGGPTFLRPPYGHWREPESPGGPEKPGSVVAERLRAAGRFPGHVGPVHWDVDGRDWECWRQGLPAEECARRYLAEVERRGRGIVLLHDSSEEEEVRPRNRSVQATKLLIPALRRRGYRFVRLDAVPQVRSAVGVRDQVTLATWDGRPLRCVAGCLRATAGGQAEVFGIVPLGWGRVALRAANGLFLAAGWTRVRARGEGLGRREIWEMRDAGDGCVAFRTAAGRYLSAAPRSGRLSPSARRCGEAERFRLGRRFGD